MKTIPAGVEKTRGMAGGKWGDIYIVRREPETIYESSDFAALNAAQAQYGMLPGYCRCCGRSYHGNGMSSGMLGLLGIGSLFQ